MGMTRKAVVASSLFALLATLILFVVQRLARTPSHPDAAVAAEPAISPDLADPQPHTALREEAERLAADLDVSESPPTVQPDLFASLRLLVRWSDDRMPAAGVAARVSQRKSAHKTVESVDARTGEDGTVLIEGLLPERVTVRLDRGLIKRADLTAGEVTELPIEIPPGVEVQGLVTDDSGGSVADADICLKLTDFGADDFVVATSSVDGTFFVRAVPGGALTHLFARAAGRAPTNQVVVNGSPGSRTMVRLVFTEAGVPLSGRVTTPSGEPIRNAVVIAGHDGLAGQTTPATGAAEHTPAAESARTDDHGRFRFASVRIGSIPLQARAIGFAPWKEFISTEQQQQVEIVLSPGVRLEGRVTNENGEPMLGIQISVGDPFSQGGSSTRSAADGTYVLTDLAPGRIEAAAFSGGGGGKAITLEGGAGETLRWDPVFGAGLRLSGRILAQGHSLENWRIEAWPSRSSTGPGGQMEVLSDDEGRFTFKDCLDRPYQLRVSLPRSETFLYPVAILDDVRPGGGEILVALDRALAPSVYLTGRVVDPDGRPVGVASCSIGSSRFSYGVVFATDRETGAFRVGPYPAGEWWVDVSAAGYPAISSEKRRVEAGETCDFGDLRLQLGGTVVVRLVGETGMVGRVSTLYGRLLDAENGWLQGLSIRNGVARSGRITAGRYWVVALDSEVTPMSAVHEFEVRDGQETLVDVELRTGVPVLFRFRADADSPPVRVLGFDIFDTKGRRIAHGTGVRATSPWVEVSKRLLPGTYRLQATSLIDYSDPPKWRRAEGEFVVTATEELGKTVHEFILSVP